MRSNYRKIGEFIHLVDVRNKHSEDHELLGLSITKEFIPSVANIVGTNMANYKVIKKGQFACSLMQVRRDKKIPVALQQDFDIAIISQAYFVFEVVDQEDLIPEYLMMWMSRAEFDRHACFLAVGGVRGSLEWEDFCDMELPVPSIEKQWEIVREYNIVNDRIALNKQVIKNLEDAAQIIYKQWFMDFEFPISKEIAESIGNSDLEGKPYKSSGGEMTYSEALGIKYPVIWDIKNISEICEVINGRAYRHGEYRESGTKIIRIQNLSGGDKWLYSDLELPEKKYVSNGDLIFAWSATFGPFIWRQEKSIYHYHIWRMDCFEPNAKLFLYHHLNRVTKSVSEQGSGSVFSHITKGLMESQQLVYPDNSTLHEFNHFASKLDERLATTLKIMDSCRSLKEIIKTRMSKA